MNKIIKSFFVIFISLVIFNLKLNAEVVKEEDDSNEANTKVVKEEENVAENVDVNNEQQPITENTNDENTNEENTNKENMVEDDENTNEENMVENDEDYDEFEDSFYDSEFDLDEGSLDGMEVVAIN